MLPTRKDAGAELEFSTAAQSEQFRPPPGKRKAPAKMVSEQDLSGEHVAKHREVPDQAVQRMAKRGGTIFFKNVMTDPGKTVAEYRHEPNDAEGPGGKRIDERTDHQRSADKMQAAAGPVAVFAQIEGIEIAKTVESFVGRFSHIQWPAGNFGQYWSAIIPGAAPQ